MFRRSRLSSAHLEEDPKLFTLFLQDWVALAERIDCPAPLPEDPESELLTRMLFPAPYEVPEKKAKKTTTGTRKGLRHKGTLDVMSEDDEAHSSVPEDNDEEEEEEDNNPSPQEKKKKKRAASAHLEAQTPKKGKGVPAVNTAWDVASSPERRPHAKPQAAS